MPWDTVMEQRHEFVLQALKKDRNFSLLCSQYGISRKTGYKWKMRYEQEGLAGLEDRPRARHHQATQTSEEICNQIIKVRQQNPE